jgi:hypothetical protein
MTDILVGIITSPITMMLIMVVWGMLIQNFWFNKIGKVTLLNAIGRNLIIVEITMKSRRIIQQVTKATEVEYTYENNTYNISESKRHFIGNVPIVRFNEGNSTSPDSLEPLKETRDVNATCPNCSKNIVIPNVPITILEETNAKKVNAFLTLLRAFLEATLLNRNQFILTLLAILVPIATLAILFEIFIGLPSTGVDLAGRETLTYDMCRNALNASLTTMGSGAKVV